MRAFWKNSIGIVLSTVFLFSFTAMNVKAELQVREEKKEEIKNSGPHQGHKIKAESVKVKKTNGEEYIFNYQHCLDPSHQKEKTPVGGSLGLKIPSHGGFYPGDAIRIIADKKNLMEAAPATCTIINDKSRVFIVFLWDTEAALFSFTFLMFDDRAGVFVETNMEPKKKIEALVMNFTVYPGGYTRGWNMPGERVVTTAGGQEISVKSFIETGAWKEETSKTLVLSPPKDFLVFFADKLFDFGKHEKAMGPAGLVFLPETVRKGTVMVTGYGIEPSLEISPETGKSRIALFEFPDKPNSAALAYMKAEADSIKGILAKTDFQITRFLVRNIGGDLDKCRKHLAEVDEKKLKEKQTEAFNRFKNEMTAIQESLRIKDSPLIKLAVLQQQADSLLKEVEEFCYQAFAN